MLLIGIDEAGYGPRLGPLCHGYAAIRLPDGARELAANLWRALHPAVGRAGSRGIAIDDSKKVYSGDRDLRALETGVRAFFDCAGKSNACPSLDLDALLPAEDFDDLKRNSWFNADDRCHVAAPLKAARLQRALSKIGAEIPAVGARAMSARAYNANLSHTANKADLSWRVIACELKRLAALAAPNEPIVAAIDRQGGRKFYAAQIAEIFECALVHCTLESPKVSVYCVEQEARKIEVGFYVDGDAQHLPIALASMAAKLAREKYMWRFNTFFQRHQPDLKPTAGYYGDAARFLRDTKSLREKLAIHDAHFIRER